MVAFGAVREQFEKRFGLEGARFGENGVGAAPAEVARQPVPALAVVAVDGPAGGGRRNTDGATRFGVLHQQADAGGPPILPGIAQGHGDEVVASPGDAEGPLVPRVHKIGNQENHGPAPLNATEGVQGGFDRRAPTLRRVGKDLADQAQNMPPGFSGRNVFFHPVGKKHQSGLVVVSKGRKREKGRDLGGPLGLELAPAAEPQGTADVHQKHHRQFAFFDEFFDERMAQAGRHVPVDASNVVAGKVFPNLGELHAPALKGAGIGPGEQIAHQAPGRDFDPADVAKDFGGERGGHGKPTPAGVRERRLR